MSLGYVKGQFWIPDEYWAAFTKRDSYAALLRAMRRAGFSFDCRFSYTTRVYTAEITTMERFKSSAQIYTIKHNNAFDKNPMAAVTSAIRGYAHGDPLVALCCLEIECELLRDAVAFARRQEVETMRLEGKLVGAIMVLEDTLSLLAEKVTYECEDCIGMMQHGCFCQSMGCPAPGVPPRAAETYDEDDDL